MSQKNTLSASQKKRQMILEKSREVFGEKGYSSVTMADVVEACEISRGGLYLYYPSIEELFQAVIIDQSKQKFSIINDRVARNEPFKEIFAQYLDLQEARLQNIDDLILVATYEFYKTHQEKEQVAFQENYVAYLRQTIGDLLRLGVSQAVIANDNIEALSETFILLLEGLSIFKTFNHISDEHIHQQILMLNSLIVYC